MFDEVCTLILHSHFALERGFSSGFQPLLTTGYRSGLLVTVVRLLLQDWWEMFIHHLATLALLTLSWTTQMFRSGTVVTPSDVCYHAMLSGSDLW